MAIDEKDVEQLRMQVAALAARMARLEAVTGTAPASPGESEQLRPPMSESPPSPVHASSGGAVRLKADTTAWSPSGAAPATPRDQLRERALPAGQVSLETRIGSHWLNRIGIVAVLIGVSYFLRYAFENDWIGPAGRVALGLLAGAGVVLWSERFRTTGYPAFSWSLKAVGIGTLYLSLWAAFQLYRLVPVELAFAAMMVVTASTAVLALRENAVVLAVFALLGGYATPVLLSTGVSRPVELFLYVALLNAGVLAMVRYRPWIPLLAGAFAGTVALYGGWYASFFTAADRLVATGFATTFFAMFAVAPLLARGPHDLLGDQPDETVPGWSALAVRVLLLLPLVNAGVYFVLLLALLEPVNENLPPVAALLLALVYLWLAGLVRTRLAEMSLSSTLALLHAGVALALVTIAIPLELDAHWITLGWLVEAGVLLWIGQARGSELVTRFGVVALALGILRLLIVDNFRTELVLLNQRFLTFAIAIGLLAAIAWFGRRRGNMSGRALAITTVALNVLALVALSREVQAYFRPAPGQTGSSQLVVDSAAQQFAYSAVWMGYAALVMIAGFALRWAILRWQALSIVGITVLKVFLYDIANLDQAYKILSFIALGLLLLAISFAYQRDWLKLRDEGGAAARARSA